MLWEGFYWRTVISTHSRVLFLTRNIVWGKHCEENFGGVYIAEIKLYYRRLEKLNRNYS